MAATQLDSAPGGAPERRESRRVARALAWRPHPALGILLVVVAVWIVVFARLVYLRHARFYSFGFDLGIHDQAIWLMSRGDPTGMLSVRGIPALGHHVTVAYWFLAPAYWLGAGAQFIDVLQVICLAAPALVLYHLARHRCRSEWIGLAVGCAWLAHPSVQFLVWETFHPDAMGIVWIMGAYLAARTGRWRWFWVCAVVAMTWKEDFGLAVLMLGVVMLVWGERRRALAAMAAGALWFVLATNVIMPAITGHGVHAGTFYGELGESPTEVAWNSARHPDIAWKRLEKNDAAGYVRRVSEPFGHVALLGPLPALVGLPMLVINLLSTAYFVVDVRYHYVSLPLAATALAAVEGLALVRSRSRRGEEVTAAAVVVMALTAAAFTGAANGSWWVLAGAIAVAGTATIGAMGYLAPRHLRLALVVVLVASAGASYRIHGIGPLGADRNAGYWPGPNRQAEKEAALALVPDGAGVSSTYGFVPHLTHRRLAYEFPNPWVPTNWGVRGEDPADPLEVDWVVVDLLNTADDIIPVYEALLSSGQFQEVYRAREIVVATRVSDTTR